MVIKQYSYFFSQVYILNLVTKISHFLKLKYKESNLQNELPCSNFYYTKDGIFNLHMGCHSVHRGSGGGGIVYYEIQRIVHLFHVIYATDIRTQKF